MRLACKSNFSNGSSQNHVGVFGCEPKSRTHTFMQKEGRKVVTQIKAKSLSKLAHLKAQTHAVAPAGTGLSLHSWEGFPQEAMGQQSSDPSIASLCL